MAATDREAILDWLATDLDSAGYWAGHVRKRESGDAIPEDFSAPFCIVHPIDSKHEMLASNQSFNFHYIGITVYADYEHPEWSLVDSLDSQSGLLTLQDNITARYIRSTLNSLCDFAFIVQHGEAVPVDLESEEGFTSLLRSTSVMEVRNFQAG